MNSRSRRLPTSVPVPVDENFIPMFVAHGWQRVERIWGKSRVAVWRRVVGVAKMRALRREFLLGRKV